MADRHVHPRPGGGWKVVAPGTARGAATAYRLRDAIDIARRSIAYDGGGRLVIYDTELEIVDEWTVPAFTSQEQR